MAEVEIHAGHEHSNDEFGRRVGVMVGIIGIFLAIVTISSHRAHTAAVIERTKANDQWSFYQAKKLRQHLADVGAGLASALATDPARVEKLVESLNKDKERYAHETEEIQKEANAKEKQSDHEEERAVWLDLGEGFLELGLVLSSLYFLSKRRFFPVLGGLGALIGLGLGVYGYLA
jgi:Domain of unknown function (DUF4337)